MNATPHPGAVGDRGRRVRVNWLTPLALFAGAVLPMQVALNGQLRDRLGSPLVAALLSFVVGTAALCAVVLVAVRPLPSAGQFGDTSWWMWLGGLCGALYVASSIVLLPRIGAAATIALVLTGQVLASLMLDHFGLLRVPVHQLSIGRTVGAILLIAGVLLIQRF